MFSRGRFAFAGFRRLEKSKGALARHEDGVIPAFGHNCVQPWPWTALRHGVRLLHRLWIVGPDRDQRSNFSGIGWPRGTQGVLDGSGEGVVAESPCNCSSLAAVLLRVLPNCYQPSTDGPQTARRSEFLSVGRPRREQGVLHASKEGDVEKSPCNRGSFDSILLRVVPTRHWPSEGGARSREGITRASVLQLEGPENTLTRRGG